MGFRTLQAGALSSVDAVPADEATTRKAEEWAEMRSRKSGIQGHEADESEKAMRKFWSSAPRCCA